MTTPKTTVRRPTSTRKTPTTTTTRSTSAAKAAAEKRVALELEAVEADAPAPEPETQAETLPDSTEAPVLVPELKKKELIDLAVERSGIKKREAKPAIEAALAVLGEALSEGRELNLVPLGKVKIKSMKHMGGAQIINARVRQPEDDNFPTVDPLAHAAE